MFNVFLLCIGSYALGLSGLVLIGMKRERRIAVTTGIALFVIGMVGYLIFGSWLA